MKINAKAYRSFDSFEPVEVQTLENNRVEIYYMNDSKFLSQYVPRGRFYFWTSDGKDYRLIVERGFYEKVSYFFAEDINSIWVSFLNDLGATYKKNNRIYFALTVGVMVLILALGLWLLQDQLVWVFVGAMALSLVANAVYSRKISKIVEAKNIKAQEEIRVLLTPSGFDKLIEEQQAYMKEYFDFDESGATDVAEEDDMLEAELEIEDEISVPADEDIKSEDKNEE